MRTLLFIFIFGALSFNCFSQKDAGDTYYYDTLGFEEPYEFLLIDTSDLNIWQIGIPNNEYFDSSFSGSKAILTDALHLYPTNNYSYFDLLFGEFNYEGLGFQLSFEFKHKFDTDTLRDGGYISISYDNGLTWLNVIKDTTNHYEYNPNTGYGLSNNIYTNSDTLINGEFGFSGKSDGWISTVISWGIIPVKKERDFIGDTLIIRFSFISDSVDTQKEGWMIDDIMLFYFDWGGNVNELNDITNFAKVYPNPVNEESVLFFENPKFVSYTIEVFNLLGNSIYKESKIQTNKILLNKLNLKNGIYLYTIYENKKIVGVGKIIK